MTKITLTELREIVADKFKLEGKHRLFKNSSKSNKDIRCLFIRLAYIHCEGNFVDIGEYLQSENSLIQRQVSKARVLMKNAYYINVINIIEKEIKWRNKH